MAMATRSWAVVLLLSLFLVACAADATVDHAKNSASDAAAAAQDSARSWTDLAKDKLNLFAK